MPVRHIHGFLTRILAGVLLEVGFRPRRVAKLLAIQPGVVYDWRRRFAASGLLGLTTRARAGTPITTRVSVQVMMPDRDGA